MSRVTPILFSVALGACVAPPDKSERSNDSEAAAFEPEPAAPTPGPTFAYADAGPVEKQIADFRAAELAKGRVPLIYVGASWCEPCVAFHAAADAGELDQDFPDLSLLEFDADVSAADLKKSGYTFRLIPLFAGARADGRPSGRRQEGGVKGEQAVRYIAKRLVSVVDQTREDLRREGELK